MAFRTLIGAAAAALIALPAASQETPQALGDAFIAAVEAEDAEALAALYTEDADSYGPGGGDRVSGREAIAAGWTEFFASFEDFSASTEEQGSLDMGEDGYASWGLWTMTATPSDGGDPVTWDGRYMDVQVKTDDGWRYRADHASMRSPEGDSADKSEE